MPTATVQVSVSMPLDMVFRVTKKLLRSPKVRIEAVNRDRILLECPSCHRVWKS